MSRFEARSTYAEFRPALHVAHLLECEWVRAARSAGVTAVLPDGCVDIVWRSDGEFFIAGPDRGPVEHHHPPDVEFVGLRLVPGTAASVLRVPVDELCDQRVPLATLWGRRADRISERLMGSAAGDRRRLLVDAAVSGVGADDLDARVMAAVSALGSGTRTTADLEERTGLGARQLRRRFAQQVGFGPKTYQRVARFRRFLALAESGRHEHNGLAGLAVDAGYSDQAHLNRECLRLAGQTPTQFLGDRFVQDDVLDPPGSSPT